MPEIVQGGQTFEIKGDAPTPQEQVAIDTFLQARNLDDEKTGIQDLDEGRIFLTPDQILSDAQKGKYNKDTESFLSSPTFKRIVTEVGLSIAGGIAGAAAAPFSGGASLAVTATMAARIARLARPLLNISANTVGKIGRATAGAAIGGGTGAGIAQAFDPKEDIVKEVARGAFQGGFGEVLGFGMAGALGKVYNKVAGQKLQMIKGGRAAAQTIARQKAYYNLLDKASKGEKITEDLIAKTQTKIGSELSREQAKILKNPELAKQRADFLKQERGEDFFKRIEEGTLTPALITENNMIDTLENIIGSSFFGGGRMMAAQQGSRLGLLGAMDEFVDTTMKGVDQGLLNPGVLGTQIQQAVTNSNIAYNRVLTEGYKKLIPAIQEATEQVTNGRIIPKPGYGIDLSWNGVRKNYVWNSTTRETEDSVSFFTALNQEARRLDRFKQKAGVEDAVNLVNELSTLNKTSTIGEVMTEYRTLSRNLAQKANSPEYQTVGRKLQKILKAELDKANMPATLRAEYNKLSQLTQMGGKLYNNGIFQKIAKYDTGQKAILDQILVKGKNDIATDFFNKLDMTDTGIVDGLEGAGRRLLPKVEADRLKDAVRGQFIKRFIDSSTEAKDQYLYLQASKARQFVEKDFADIIADRSFLSERQAGHLKEFVQALKFADGAISAPGTKANRGTIFIQLKEAGAISQLAFVGLAGGGVVDPATAGTFVLAPFALSRLFTNPKLMNLLINGTKGAKYRDFGQFSRFTAQLGSGLVSEGLIDEEQNSMVQQYIKTNQSNYEKLFKGELPDNDFYSEQLTEFNPANEPQIPVELNQPRPGTDPRTQQTAAAMPLPNVQPSALPVTGQSNTDLAQALNLFG